MRKAKTNKAPVASQYLIARSQHNISKADISQNALNVVNQLIKHGYQAYLVGGCVRDLLIGKAPKDFDVATDATPNQIKKLFRNSRIIGRRFKLVHILFHNRETIEVATFRAGHETHQDNTNDKGMLVRDNVFGTLEDDAWRRDFTINSLYYNVQDSSIIDFTEGFKDIHDKQLSIIGDAKKRYEEDPVRMLRAIRFAAKLHFSISNDTAAPIHQLNGLLSHISNARLFDEMTKLYQCGESFKAQSMMLEYGLFDKLFPLIDKVLEREDYPIKPLMSLGTASTDSRIQRGKTVNPAFIFAVLLWFPLRIRMLEIQDELKFPPLPALEKAMSDILMQQWKTIAIPKRYTQMIREIWVLQFRFPKRAGERAWHLLEHPRFRAAYDFLLLRAEAGDEEPALATWWTSFQSASEETQQSMVAELVAEIPPVKKKRRRKKPSPT